LRVLKNEIQLPPGLEISRFWCRGQHPVEDAQMGGNGLSPRPWRRRRQDESLADTLSFLKQAEQFFIKRKTGDLERMPRGELRF
jgi:hypothetical protein